MDASGDILGRPKAQKDATSAQHLHKRKRVLETAGHGQSGSAGQRDRPPGQEGLKRAPLLEADHTCTRADGREGRDPARGMSSTKPTPSQPGKPGHPTPYSNWTG